jgi:hypothetical protein
MSPVSWYTECCRLIPGCLATDQSGRMWRVVTGPFLQAGQVRVRAVMVGNPAVWSELPAECLRVSHATLRDAVSFPPPVALGMVDGERLELYRR